MDWTDRTRKILVSYGAAVGLTALAVFVRWLIDPILGSYWPFVTLFAAVAAAQWLGGYRPALLSTVFGLVATTYLFILPMPNVAVTAQIIGSLGYLISCAAIIAFGEAARSARRIAEADRDRLNREIHDRLAADAIHRSSEERYHRLIQSELIGIAFFHVDGRITDANNTYLKLLGYSREDLIRGRMRWDRLIAPESLPAARQKIEDLQTSGQVSQYEQELVRKDGTRFWGLLGAASLATPGEGISFVLDITKRKRAEEMSRQAREQLQLVADTIPAHVARCSRDGRFVWTNRRNAARFGITPEEAVGRPFAELMGEEAVAAIEPYVRRVLAGETVEYEAEVNYRVGGRKWMHAAYAPTFDAKGVPDGWVAVITDIGQRKELEQAVRDSEQQFRLLAETVPSIVWTAAPDGTITYANPRWYEYCGLTPEENARDWPQFVLHPDDRERCAREWTSALSEGREYEIEVRNRRHDGVYRWFVTRAVPRRDVQGKVVSWFGVTTDIQDQKEIAEQLRDADRRKDEFLATLAHELRNPLAPIRNAARIMGMMDSIDPSLATARDVIDRQVRQMTRLVDDLLDVSRITRGKIQLQRLPIDLASIIRDAVETTSPMITAAGHEFLVSLPPTPVLVDADGIRMSQVFANLLHNAAKYTEPGGRICLTVEPNGSEVAIHVRDSGIGIAAEHLPRLFEMFSQVAPALERSQGGLGIGLSLVKGLIDLHGGRIEAHSDGPGLGCVFTVRLSTIPHREIAKRVELSIAPGPASPRKILVVDDNRDAANTLSSVLRMHGHEVRSAFDGVGALEVASAFKPDVVLLDIGMPRMNGYDVAQQIRQTDWGRDSLLIATTGWGQEEDKRRAKEAGFDHHLTKPVDPAVLVAMLASAVA